MEALQALAEQLPEPAKDVRLNLLRVMGPEGGALTPAQRWGTALAAAFTAGCAPLTAALRAAAAERVAPGVVEDAQAAAALMAMNNVYYRFRHQVGRPDYGRLPARLRMTRLGRPATSKLDLEVFCLAVSAINGCEACVRSHEETLLAGGVTVAQVDDAVRVAAVVRAAATALGLAAGVTA